MQHSLLTYVKGLIIPQSEEDTSSTDSFELIIAMKAKFICEQLELYVNKAVGYKYIDEYVNLFSSSDEIFTKKFKSDPNFNDYREMIKSSFYFHLQKVSDIYMSFENKESNEYILYLSDMITNDVKIKELEIKYREKITDELLNICELDKHRYIDMFVCDYQQIIDGYINNIHSRNIEKSVTKSNCNLIISSCNGFLKNLRDGICENLNEIIDKAPECNTKIFSFEHFIDEVVNSVQFTTFFEEQYSELLMYVLKIKNAVFDYKVNYDAGDFKTVYEHEIDNILKHKWFDNKTQIIKTANDRLLQERMQQNPQIERIICGFDDIVMLGKNECVSKLDMRELKMITTKCDCDIYCICDLYNIFEIDTYAIIQRDMVSDYYLSKLKINKGIYVSENLPECLRVNEDIFEKFFTKRIYRGHIINVLTFVDYEFINEYIKYIDGMKAANIIKNKFGVELH